jgi:hypothetical protein
MTFPFRLAALAGALALGLPAHAQQAPRPAAPAASAAAPGAGSADIKSDPDKENAGKLAAHGWLSVLDRKDWGTAWEMSSSIFRQTVPLPNWMDGIPKVREQFGVIVQREPLEAIYKTTLPGRANGHYVTVNFASKFEKATVNEIVTTMLDTDGRWRVTGYSYTTR